MSQTARARQAIERTGNTVCGYKVGDVVSFLRDPGWSDERVTGTVTEVNIGPGFGNKFEKVLVVDNHLYHIRAKDIRGHTYKPSIQIKREKGC